MSPPKNVHANKRLLNTPEEIGRLWDALHAADRGAKQDNAANGYLGDVHDQDPTLNGRPIVITPELNRKYQLMYKRFQGLNKQWALLSASERQTFFKGITGDLERDTAKRYKRTTAAPHTSRSQPLISFVSLKGDSKGGVVDTTTIQQVMALAGTHRLRLSTLVELFPHAHLKAGTTISKMTLSELVKEKPIRGEVELKDAYVDVAGELIISHLPFVEKKLIAWAPTFDQFFRIPKRKLTVEQKAVCGDKTKASTWAKVEKGRKKTTYTDCDPDSWGLDIGTMAAHSRLKLHGKIGDFGARHTAIINALAEVAKQLPEKFDPPLITVEIAATEKGEITRTATIDFREDPRLFRKNLQDDKAHPFRHKQSAFILRKLNEQLPELAVDPASREQINFHLGRHKDTQVTDRDLAVVLFHLLDHPKAILQYGDETKKKKARDFNAPAFASHWNQLAGRPSLHLAARIHPNDLGHIYFRADHLDTASYKPLGHPVGKGMYPKKRAKYQHEGESEPFFARFEIDGSRLALQDLYYGNHYNLLVYDREEFAAGSERDGLGKAEAVRIFDNGGRPRMGISYLSGGRSPTPLKSVNRPGPTMHGGGRTPTFVWLFTATKIFTFYEGTPGSDDRAHAAHYEPDLNKDHNNSLKYRIVLEGRDGFIPFQSLMQSGARGKGSLNTNGYPLLRGDGQHGNVYNRFDDSVYEATQNQRERYYEHESQGDVLRTSFTQRVLFSKAGPVGELDVRINPWAGQTFLGWKKPGWRADLLIATPGLRITEEINPTVTAYYPAINGAVYLFTPPTYLRLPFEIGAQFGRDFDRKRWLTPQDILYIRGGLGLVRHFGRFIVAADAGFYSTPLAKEKIMPAIQLEFGILKASP